MNKDKSVKISRDGGFNTGQDRLGYYFKYVAHDVAFWFSCETAFLSQDRTSFIIDIYMIGQKERGLPSFFVFSERQRQVIRDQIVQHFSENTMANIMSPQARLVALKIRFTTEPPITVRVADAN